MSRNERKGSLEACLQEQVQGYSPLTLGAQIANGLSLQEHEPLEWMRQVRFLTVSYLGLRMIHRTRCLLSLVSDVNQAHSEQPQGTSPPSGKEQRRSFWMGLAREKDSMSQTEVGHEE